MASEALMTRREDISPFLFPCAQCKQYIFHGVYEQPHGLMVKIPFMSRPLMSSHVGYQLVCEKCRMVNGRLESEDVRKLSANLLPKSIWVAYPAIQQFYQPGYYEQTRHQLVGDPPDPELAAYIDKWMSAYRLEV